MEIHCSINKASLKRREMRNKRNKKKKKWNGKFLTDNRVAEIFKNSKWKSGNVTYIYRRKKKIMDFR